MILAAHDPTGADVLAMLPFVISSLVWGFSVLLWVPRRWSLWTPVDLMGEVVAIIGAVTVDILSWAFGGSRARRSPIGEV